MRQRICREGGLERQLCNRRQWRRGSTLQRGVETQRKVRPPQMRVRERQGDTSPPTRKHIRSCTLSMETSRFGRPARVPIKDFSPASVMQVTQQRPCGAKYETTGSCSTCLKVRGVGIQPSMLGGDAIPRVVHLSHRYTVTATGLLLNIFPVPSPNAALTFSSPMYPSFLSVCSIWL